ncbi:MAG: 2-hydroxyacid dehydrogenase [Aeromicrobium sp.]|uniref:2-hydroxyacid dehydrogenase n=1 Tax=Aeromicrobium sp. TaxID=1871063 RepID=UPI003C6056ED
MTDMALRISVPDDSWVDTLSDLSDRVEVVVWDTETAQPDGHLDLVLRPYALSNDVLAGFDTSRIGLVQSQALGFDGVAETLPTGGVYANAVGVHEASTAELAVTLVLASLRHVDDFARAMPAGTWEQPWTSSLIDRRVMLLGVGGIGGELAKRLAGFDADMVRVGSVARDDESGRVHGTVELPDLLPAVDVVIVAVPLTEQTTGLVDDKFLAALPDGALVVNVARGKVVDTAAVVRAAGRIRFAADVLDPEPLPSDHPLWHTPGVLISPHVGGKSSAMRPRVERVVRGQIARLLAGEEPDAVVVRT